MAASTDEHFVVRVRGLPWACTDDEVAEFFCNCEMLGGKEGIHFTKNRDGRPSGDAYIELCSLKDVKEAMKMNNKNMGKRYIEVFEARWSEMEWMLQKNVNKEGKELPDQEGDFEVSSEYVVRLRGLPFEAGKDEVERFFDGIQIANNGVLFTKDRSGRPSGQCYAVFSNEDDLEKALEKNNKNMGHRYIEVFKSTQQEAEMEARAKERGFDEPIGPFGRGGGPMRRGGRGFMGGFRAGPYDRPGGGFGRGGMGGRMGGGGMGGGIPPLGMGYGRVPPFGDGMGMGGGMGMGMGGGMGMGMGGGMGMGRSGGGGRGFGSFAGNGGGFGRGGGGGGYGSGGYSGFGENFLVKMRGLPFSANIDDISRFFSDKAKVIDAEIQYGMDGRPTGTAEVLFGSMADAKAAMGKHKCNMGSRYVELFFEGPI